MKSQDIVILLKLIGLQDQEVAKDTDQLRSESIGGGPYSARNLEALLGISKTEIAQSIRGSVASGIARKDSMANEPRHHCGGPGVIGDVNTPAEETLALTWVNAIS
ncbi:MULTISPECIES: hypothetical protein [Rhizobium]|uniref:hypothetical protein n=1 Tax=Rhizobium TaxID=379 RepID=UPI001FE198A9|nr:MULTISPECIES: hypothetical protein [Rhizobium]